MRGCFRLFLYGSSFDWYGAGRGYFESGEVDVGGLIFRELGECVSGFSNLCISARRFLESGLALRSLWKGRHIVFERFLKRRGLLLLMRLRSLSAYVWEGRRGAYDLSVIFQDSV